MYVLVSDADELPFFHPGCAPEQLAEYCNSPASYWQTSSIAWKILVFDRENGSRMQVQHIEEYAGKSIK